MIMGVTTAAEKVFGCMQAKPTTASDKASDMNFLCLEYEKRIDREAVTRGPYQIPRSLLGMEVDDEEPT